MTRRATVFGATGLVGQELVQLLATSSEYSVVTRVLRRPVPALGGVADRICDDLLQVPDELLTTDVVFCCLGTTMKKAGSKEAFAKVDFEMPVALAKKLVIANPNGHFVLISAMGADADSSVYYNKVKGQTEDALGNLKLGRLSIVRPSLLLGERAESRPMEALGIKLAPALNVVLWGPMKKFRAIEAADVARAMVACDLRREGNGVYSSDVLTAMAGR